MEFMEACKQLIAIDSSPSNGTGELSRFIKKLGEELGFKVYIEENHEQGPQEANVLCFPEERKEKVHLMLQTHLDTYDPGDFALWERTGKNPFQPTIHGGQLYGLGVADTKLDFLCKLYASRKFIGKKSKKAFAIVGTYGEESDMGGSVQLIQSSLKADRALVSEPTGFHVAVSGKGLARFEITIPFSPEERAARKKHDRGEGQSTHCKIFKGVAAHSSQPLEGENAIEKMLNYLDHLPSNLLLLEVDGGTNDNSIPTQSLVEFDLVPVGNTTANQKLLKIYKKILAMKKTFESIQDPEFDPPMTTLNMGMIRTHGEAVKITGCLRWPEVVGETTYGKWLGEIGLYCRSVGAVFQVRDHKKPFSTPRDSEFVKLCHQSVLDQVAHSRLTTQPVTNEANVFDRLGLETLALGPGLREGNSQTPEESIPIENLHKAVKVYENVIKSICYD